MRVSRTVRAVTVALLAASCGGGVDVSPTPAETAGLGGHVDVIVVLREEVGARDLATARARAASVALELGLSPTHVYGAALRGFAASVPSSRLDALRSDPRVAYVDLDGPVGLPMQKGKKPGGGGDPPAAQVTPWGITAIGAEGLDGDGEGVHVYVLDTGIDSKHADLSGNLGSGHAVEKCRRCPNEWDDDHGHGTHVAGTIAAADDAQDVVGVAPLATLHAVKVLSKAGSGTRSGVIAGVDWVAAETTDRGSPSVANMSLGGTGSRTGTCSADGFLGTDAYHEAICNAKNAGVVFAVAAGNSGADASGSVPAAYDDAVITVSATRFVANSGDWPNWSNWGDAAADWTAAASAPVAIAAPGVSILSTKRGGGTTTMSGTSMAAPHVAGALALYLAGAAAAADGSAFEEARDALLAAATDTAGWENTSGNAHEEAFLDASGL